MDLFRLLEKERKNKAPSGPPEWIIAGLGNPGDKYEQTRHNIGFLALDTLAGKYNIPVKNLKFKALCGQGTIGNANVLLIKPQTFMNLSGESVSEAAKFYKIPKEKIIIIYDDISMETGKLRIREKGSAGGHNGIKDIILRLNSDVFPRIKIGVGAPPHPDYDIVDWVLGTFSEEDKRALIPAIDKVVASIPVFIEKGAEAAKGSLTRGV